MKLSNNMRYKPCAMAQCNKCKDTFVLMWDYIFDKWEDQPLAYNRRGNELFHKCNGKLKVWFSNN